MWGIDAALDLKALVASGDREHLAWLETIGNAGDRELFGSIKSKFVSTFSFGELKWQHTHADKVRAVDTLVALSNDGLYAEQ